MLQLKSFVHKYEYHKPNVTLHSLMNNKHFPFSDPYVKVWLQFGDKRIEKRKTPIFKCNLNPHFNDSFSFNVPWEKIRECSLDVMVLDFDNIGRNELIGRILLAGELIFLLLIARRLHNVNLKATREILIASHQLHNLQFRSCSLSLPIVVFKIEFIISSKLNCRV